MTFSYEFQARHGKEFIQIPLYGVTVRTTVHLVNSEFLWAFPLKSGGRHALSSR